MYNMYWECQRIMYFYDDVALATATEPINVSEMFIEHHHDYMLATDKDFNAYDANPNPTPLCIHKNGSKDVTRESFVSDIDSSTTQIYKGEVTCEEPQSVKDQSSVIPVLIFDYAWDNFVLVFDCARDYFVCDFDSSIPQIYDEDVTREKLQCVENTYGVTSPIVSTYATVKLLRLHDLGGVFDSSSYEASNKNLESSGD